MAFVEILKSKLQPYYLLEHPFYQKWQRGEVSKQSLQYYASQYYHHVSAFPRYISALHSLCVDEKARQILLENLNDEEGFQGTPHPQLWMDFAEGLGVDKKTVQESKPCVAINKLMDTLFSHCRSSYARGLSALYSYEYQVPEVAETKMQGLKEHYNITDEKTLKFFVVHKTADVYHRKAIEVLLEQLDTVSQEEALESAQDTAGSLWNFLTEVDQQYSTSA